jgi:hypothetical protein
VAPETRCHPGRLLAQGLRYARDRGLSFDDAWRQLLPTVWPRDSALAVQWREALEATREEWRAAYEGRSTGFSRAYPVLLLDLPMTDSAPPARGSLVA